MNHTMVRNTPIDLGSDRREFLELIVNRQALMRGKGLVAAEPGSAAIIGHNPEMVGGAGDQTIDVGTDVPVRVSGLCLHGGGVAVTSRWVVLESDGRDQRMWIQ